MALTITIDDPVLAEDLRVLAAATKETPDSFVAHMLKIAIDVAAEQGAKREEKRAKRKGS